ncbi:MAG: ATP-binding cassette domain-containing protein, partial [Parcubacteria group bacterium]|nr:ATP-binding cassette domain-containing protein [Parcubacteria group bacterium]
AGKTTTMSMMTGIIASDGGRILFDGVAMDTETEHGIKAKIGFLSEANPLYDEMLVEEYLDYMAGLRGMNKEQRRTSIARAAGEAGIADKLRQPIEELSKGYKQRVGLAQAILHEPEILILDEPTEGLDPNQRVTIRDLITRLGKDRTVIISTHVLSEVQAMCDQVVILNQGKIVTQGSVDEVLRAGQKGQKVQLEARGADMSAALAGLANVQIVEEKTVDGRQAFTLLSTAEGDIRPQLFALAKEKNWTVYELHEAATNFEDIFRTLTLGQS